MDTISFAPRRCNVNAVLQLKYLAPSLTFQTDRIMAGIKPMHWKAFPGQWGALCAIVSKERDLQPEPLR